MGKDNCAIPKVRPRADEIQSMFALFAIRQELEKAEKTMHKRIRSIPGGWRDLRMIEAVAEKLSTNLIDTIPQDKIPSVRANARHMTYSVHFNRNSGIPIPKDGCWALIDTMALDTIVKKSKEFSCFGCDNDCNKCALGRALDKIMIYTREKGERWQDIDLSRDEVSEND